MARNRPRLLLTLLLVLSLAGLFSSSLQRLYYLLRLPFVWRASSAAAVITQEHDQFDVTFAAYEANYSTADAGNGSLIPPILHHIHLGSRLPRAEWLEARELCLKHHASWSAFIWTEERAETLVREEFTHLYSMWKSYPYMIQRVDALRYMILQKHGGVILDYDLACKRSLEPLRQFDFVAPAAHPAGLSIGMMLSSPGNSYVKALVDNLPLYNQRWLYLPYVTVMFSTGCHYASTIYTLQSNRSSLRILSGPPDAPRMHMLNGQVNTPLFRHLGSSSWHNRDARLISLFKDLDQRALFAVLVFSLFAGTTMILCCVHRVHGRGRSSDEEQSTTVSKSLRKSA
ncbi:glycosyltransferase family 32 protein [Aspergillus novofumigatus IBT 16806]|uniref:Putative glycosyl transferase n=1 Tax=Aspergillus novofumigatus (strain IBT 16806) TaxID=1392255 RepID=A0A2I1BXR2_ASPN1|nr:putative glycosyl transferase [Aspergillus novofumigatus IBT 16806]PKX90173.1 putative glycosyl transferase [Aspergillus novofumigatus IBT 16806]